MYDTEDLQKAEQLHHLGHKLEIDIIDLAKIIYEHRQQNSNQDVEPQLLRG
tara:strand:- start:34 stop:186 length:153 start_codon:yes stop_codon:yes gene_type:complete